MTVDQLRRALTAEPFIPFTICLADGQRFPVPYREFVWIPPNQKRVFSVAHIDDHTARIIDLPLVTALSFHDN